MIGLVLVNEEELVGFGDGFLAADMVQVDPAVGEDQVRCGSAFFGAFVLVRAGACYI